MTDAGFFGYDAARHFIPVGLVISNGSAHSKIMQWGSGGVLAEAGHDISIIPIASFRAKHGISQAIQSKPLLVDAGRRGIKSDPGGLFNRVAVGLDRNGDIIIAGAFQDDGEAINLREFSDFLLMKTSQGGPETFTALNMDGGPDAHIYLPYQNMHFGYQGNNFVPNAIRFVKR